MKRLGYPRFGRRAVTGGCRLRANALLTTEGLLGHSHQHARDRPPPPPPPSPRTAPSARHGRVSEPSGDFRRREEGVRGLDHLYATGTGSAGSWVTARRTLYGVAATSGLRAGLHRPQTCAAMSSSHARSTEPGGLSRTTARQRNPLLADKRGATRVACYWEEEVGLLRRQGRRKSRRVSVFPDELIQIRRAGRGRPIRTSSTLNTRIWPKEVTSPPGSRAAGSEEFGQLRSLR